MTVDELAGELNLRFITRGDGEREIGGVYTGDLLSRVMSGCGSGDAWVTVQTHMNVVSVAELTDAACVIIPENIEMNPYTAEKAAERGINLISSSMTAYDLCWRLHGILE